MSRLPDGRSTIESDACPVLCFLLQTTLLSAQLSLDISDPMSNRASTLRRLGQGLPVICWLTHWGKCRLFARSEPFVLMEHAALWRALVELTDTS